MSTQELIDKIYNYIEEKREHLVECQKIAKRKNQLEIINIFETMLETIEEFEDYFDTILVEDDFEHSHGRKQCAY